MKFGFSALLPAFLMLAGVLVSSSATAQTWKTTDEAKTVLLDQVNTWGGVILSNTNTPTAQAYITASQHAAYYKGIMNLISNGETVASATEKALIEASNIMNASDDKTFTLLPRPERDALFAEAKALLTN